ncbi:MAG: carboxypeptidase-like regulatory domain-containing protein [Chitinophagaceae bacterium]
MSLENFKYNLQRLKKCNQDWDKMNPVNGGRHCAKCTKTIVDFSGMSFSEIAIFMSNSKKPVCGFYLPEQLKQINQTRNKLPVAIGLSALVLTTSVANAVKPAAPKMENSPIKKPDPSSIENPVYSDPNTIDTIYFTGRIQYFDTIQKKYLPVYATAVTIRGTGIGTSANSDGTFTLSWIPTKTGKIYLVIASIGFEIQEIEVPLNNQTTIDLGDITLVQENPELTQFIVRIKKGSTLNRFWRKMTKPFRP